MLATLALSLALSAAGPPRVDVYEIVSGWVRKLEETEASTRDVTFVMTKREYVDGALRPPEVMEIKFKKPHAVYVRWRGKVNQGREVLWREGWNGGDLRVRSGLFVVNLDPQGGLAMRGQRHPITHLSLAYTVEKVVDDTRRMKDHPARDQAFELVAAPAGNEHIACWRADLPRDLDPVFYAHRSEVCVDWARGLLHSVRVWEKIKGKLVLVEDYGFRDIRVNPGLTARDFDPDNPAYNF